jgi:streptogramin lyase
MATVMLALVTSSCQASDNSGRPLSPSLPPQSAVSTIAIVPNSKTVAPQQTNAPVRVNLSYLLSPALSSSNPSKTLSKSNAAYRRAEYLSTSNTQITVAVTPIGGSTVTFGPTACTTASCLVNFSANPGPNTLRFSLTNGVNVLSSFSTIQIIQPSILNTLTFTANPVVDSVTLQLASPSENAGAPVDDVLTVNAKDASGNTIIGNAPYVDANGDSVSLMLNVNNNQAGGNGTVTIHGPPIISAPLQAASYAHYDGNWLSNSTISVTSTSSALTNLTGTTLTSIPTNIAYAIPTAGAKPNGIVSGPDGNLWFCEQGQTKIGKITLSGKITEYSIAAQASSIAVGSDGNLWFVNGANSIGRITTSGAETEFPVPTPASVPWGITAGPDGNLWFTERAGDKIGKITPSGVITEFTIPTVAAQPHGIIAGPDDNIWFVEGNASKIGKISPEGQISELSVGSGGNNYITPGPGGNLWFTSNGGGFIYKVTMNGVFTPYLISGSAGSNLNYLVAGPDGNIWFTNFNNQCCIGQLSPTGTLTTYNVSNTNAQLWGITVGPDGNLWYEDQGGNFIGKFVL